MRVKPRSPLRAIRRVRHSFCDVFIVLSDLKGVVNFHLWGTGAHKSTSRERSALAPLTRMRSF